MKLTKENIGKLKLSTMDSRILGNWRKFYKMVVAAAKYNRGSHFFVDDSDVDLFITCTNLVSLLEHKRGIKVVIEQGPVGLRILKVGV